MFIARSHRYTGWIVALGLLVAERDMVAQGRPISFFAGVGGSTVSGALAGSARTAWTGGVGIDRRLGSGFALGGELIAGQRGATLEASEFLTSNSRVSFATVGVAPIARYYVRESPDRSGPSSAQASCCGRPSAAQSTMTATSAVASSGGPDSRNLVTTSVRTNRETGL
jgi:hypothetical protein